MNIIGIKICELSRNLYMTQKDIEACLTFDINTMDKHDNFEAIKELFEVFQAEYGEEERDGEVA